MPETFDSSFCFTWLHYLTETVLNNKAFREYYYSLRKHEVRPLGRMKAIGAVMNKLTRVVYAILKKSEPFNAEMVYPINQQKEVVL